MSDEHHDPERSGRGADEARVAREHARPRSGWWLLLLFAVQSIVAGIAGTLIGVSSDKDAFTTPALGVAGLAAYVVLLAGTLLYARRSGSLRDVLAARWPRLRELAMVPLVLIVVLLVSGLLNVVFHGGQAQGLDVENHPEGGLQWTWLVLGVIVLAVVAPICEELFFRGAIFSSLAAGAIGRRASAGYMLIASSAVIFGAAHLIPAAFPALAVVGLGLGYLRLRSRSVVPGMALHMLFNSIAVIAALAAGS